MAYTIQKTNGETLVNIPDTELNTDFGLTLIGRNYSGYGLYLNDNFVGLLEHFADDSPPAQPLPGQVWFDTRDASLQLWNGATWKKTAFSTASSTAPTASGRAVGDMWYDTNNQQLNVWNGQLSVTVVSALTTLTTTTVSLLSSDTVRVGDLLTTTAGITANNNVRVTQILNDSNVRVNQSITVTSGQVVTFTRDSGWYNVGPSYTRTQQLTGIFPQDLIDVQGRTHTVGLIYQRGKIIGSISRDNEYRPREADAIDRLPLIKPGITLIEESAPQLVRSVLSNVVGSGGTTTISLSSVDELQNGDFVITENIDYSARVQVTEIFVANNAVTINAATTLTLDEVITFQRGIEQSNLFYGTATNAQQLNGVTADRFATLETVQIFQDDIVVQGNFYGAGNAFVISGETGNIVFQNTYVNGGFTFTANIPGSGLGPDTVVLRLDGATGLLEVLGDPITDMGIANKSYVDARRQVALAAIASNVATLIGTAGPSRRDFGNVSNVLDAYANNFLAVNAAVALRATIDSPALTGLPTAPTAPATTANAMIATTEFVATEITTLRSTVVSNAAIQDSAINLRALIDSPTLTGEPRTSAPDGSDSSTRISTTRFVVDRISAAQTTLNSVIDTKAPLDSPELYGIPVAPTAANGTVTTQLATTAFVANAVINGPQPNLTPYASRVSPYLEGTPTAVTPSPEATGNEIATASFVKLYSPVIRVANKVGNVALSFTDIAGAAPLENPIFTGSPTTSEPAGVDRSTRIPTTSWVGNVVAPLAPANNPTFTGTVTITTPGISSNASIATTCNWVNIRLSQADVLRWGGARKYVESRAPDADEGSNGDIWFQYQP
jgi:hypothetical protein